MSKQQTISLVLGSGGARGLAHIGIIRYLEEQGYIIKAISGCSMGALVGGVYAAGKLDELESWFRAISKVDIVKLLDFSWKASGLVKGDKVIETLTQLVGDLNIEDLPINFTAVATDIVAEKEVWINSGALFDAIRASISLPLFFTPFDYNGVNLIDGGVLNPVPIAPTFHNNTDLTIAVNLGGKIEPKNSISTSSVAKAKNNNFFSNKIANFIRDFTNNEKKGQQDWHIYNIANQAFDAMQSTIARQKLAAYPADCVIEIPRNACGTLEFHRAEEMIALGYQKAKEQLVNMQ